LFEENSEAGLFFSLLLCFGAVHGRVDAVRCEMVCLGAFVLGSLLIDHSLNQSSWNVVLTTERGSRMVMFHEVLEVGRKSKGVC